jgi:hypothetical protein
MQWNWFRASFQVTLLRLLTALAGTFCLTPGSAYAETNISGRVVDLITEQPIAGAQVAVSRGGTPLASGQTANDGVFQLLVDVPVKPEPLALGIAVEKAGFDPASQQVIVTAGKASKLSYLVSLPRTEVRNCTPTWARTVVIGHVRPPASAATSLALSERIGEVLQYDLVEAQKNRLPPSQQPVVLPCPDAKPRSVAEQPYWAKALKADVFLVGNAEPVNNKFRVDLKVSAPDQDPGMPASVSTPPLNLDRPESADLGSAALEPIMLALLKAYQKERRYAECVEFAIAAQRVLGAKPELLALLDACKKKLPNNGLLGGGSP